MKNTRNLDGKFKFEQKPCGSDGKNSVKCCLYSPQFLNDSTKHNMPATCWDSVVLEVIPTKSFDVLEETTPRSKSRLHTAGSRTRCSDRCRALKAPKRSFE